MNGKELSIALREMARVQPEPLCDKWYGEWADDTPVDVLLSKYVKGFDFCVQNDYPPLEFIRGNFSSDDLHAHNIYLDEEVDIEAARGGYYVFLGGCTGRLAICGMVAATVYVRHGSDIIVDAVDGAKVFVSTYDGAVAHVGSDAVSKCFLYKR